MDYKNESPVAWLRMTPYTHAWLEKEFGGSIRVHGRPLLSVAHLPGVRDIMRMETMEDTMDPVPTRMAMSAMRMDCLRAGMDIGPTYIASTYGLTREQSGWFVPIECPRIALTRLGVLRPWARTTSFGTTQATRLSNLLRCTFWQAMARYAEELAAQIGMEPTVKDVVMGFVEDTGTPEYYIDELLREWRRQRKKVNSASFIR